MIAALEGIRVIDLTDWMHGSLGTRYLADMGAEVIKIEDPEHGDPSRDLHAVRERALKRLPDHDWNYYFECNNRNKKSIAVDLRKAAGRQLLYELCATADVFVTCADATTREDLKIDYEAIRKVNPNIVYAVASGWGRQGPAADEPAIDVLAQARAGLMSSLGEPDTPPVYTGTGEPCTAINLAYAIMMGLLHRLRNGEGQQVEASLFGSSIVFESNTLQSFLSTSDRSYYRKKSRYEVGNPLYNIYRTKDRWVFMCMLQTDRWWGNLMSVLGRPELADDPRFDSHAKRCGQSKREIIELLDSILPAKTAAKWFETRRDEIELIVTPISNFAEVANDPQAMENEYIVQCEHPSHGWIKVMGFPVQMSETPAKIMNCAPRLGQHTEEILGQLGYLQSQIDDLRASNVIG